MKKQNALKTLVEMYNDQHLGDDQYRDDLMQLDDDTDPEELLDAEIGVLESMASQKKRLKNACDAFERAIKAKKDKQNSN